MLPSPDSTSTRQDAKLRERNCCNADSECHSFPQVLAAHEHDDHASNANFNDTVILESTGADSGADTGGLDADLVVLKGGLAGRALRRLESHFSMQGRSRMGSVESTSKDAWSVMTRCRFSDGDGDVEFHTAPVKTCVPGQSVGQSLVRLKVWGI